MRLFRPFSIIAVALIALGSLTAVSAEETRTVGEYRLVIDWQKQPRMEEPNAVVVQISDAAGSPVVGVHDGITVTIGTRDRAQALPLRPVNNKPGVYEAPFIPPSPGEYSIELSGHIKNTPLNEHIVSGGGIPNVIALSQYDFGSPGAYIAYGILAAYLAGIAIMSGVMLHRKRQRSTPAKAES